MDNTSLITSTGQRESLVSTLTAQDQVPVRHQQQGFYQISASGTELVSNTYDKTGEVGQAQVQDTTEAGFDRMY